MFKSSSLTQYPGILAEKKKKCLKYTWFTQLNFTYFKQSYAQERREAMEAFNVAEIPP